MSWWTTWEDDVSQNPPTTKASANKMGLYRIQPKKNADLNNTDRIKNIKVVEHIVFDETLRKCVKQLPPEDAKIKVSLQVDSDVYVRHEPVLPLIMHKRFCVWEGSKWVHDKAKTPPLRRHVRRHGCHGRHHQWQAPTQVGTGRPWPAQQLGWPGLCSVAANLGVFLTKIYGISQFVGQ